MTDDRPMNIDEIEAIDRNAFKRGWLACHERVLAITRDFTGQGVIIHDMVKKLEPPK